MKALLQLIITLAIALGLAWILSINPAKEYGWFMGLIHGGLLVPNWLIGLFDGSWLTKAPIHTSMYNVDWWITAILNVIYWAWLALAVIVKIFSRR